MNTAPEKEYEPVPPQRLRPGRGDRMTASNLPPGCSESSLLGCGPLDEQDEWLFSHGVDWARGWELGYECGWRDLEGPRSGSPRKVLGFIAGADFAQDEVRMEQLMAGAPS